MRAIPAKITDVSMKKIAYCRPVKNKLNRLIQILLEDYFNYFPSITWITQKYLISLENSSRRRVFTERGRCKNLHRNTTTDAKHKKTLNKNTPPPITPASRKILTLCSPPKPAAIYSHNPRP
jgi:hypothetical protein